MTENFIDTVCQHIAAVGPSNWGALAKTAKLLEAIYLDLLLNGGDVEKSRGLRRGARYIRMGSRVLSDTEGADRHFYINSSKLNIVAAVSIGGLVDMFAQASRALVYKRSLATDKQSPKALDLEQAALDLLVDESKFIYNEIRPLGLAIKPQTVANAIEEENGIFPEPLRGTALKILADRLNR